MPALIETERLEVKPWVESQAVEFFELTRDDGFNLHPITVYRQPDLESAIRWIRSQNQLFAETRLGKWAVWEKASGAVIGIGGLTPWPLDGEKLVDITYRLRESAWGKGYGMELARALCGYAFGELGLAGITATITPGNFASKKILEKLGMRFDRKIQLLGGETDLYRLTATPHLE